MQRTAMMVRWRQRGCSTWIRLRPHRSPGTRRPWCCWGQLATW